MHPSPPSRSPARAGMSLIEVMIAMAILVAGMTATFSSMLTARNVQTLTQHQSLAYSEIQAQIETYQYLPFVGLQSSFKGAQFDVQGLRKADGRSSIGTVTRADNDSPYDTTLSRNTFNGEAKLPLRFRCEWDEGGRSVSVEVIFVLTYRGI
jgi:prepilin-type N-terminal cleavage/methylation domain-containing protein